MEPVATPVSFLSFVTLQFDLSICLSESDSIDPSKPSREYYLVPQIYLYQQ